jgi:hypothetical protein
MYICKRNGMTNKLMTGRTPGESISLNKSSSYFLRMSPKNPRFRREALTPSSS